MRAQFVTQASGVRFVPKADITQRSKMTYSITSSAVESSLSEMTRPSAVAVFRLITSSYLFGA